MKILIYGTGKCGSLIAYELLKEGHEVFVLDMDYKKAKKLAWDLRTIGWNIRDVWYDEVYDEEFDIVVVASSVVDLEQISKLKTVFFYIFSNVDDITFEKMKNNPKFVLCGDSVNREREFLFFGEKTLEGYHWREQPEERRKELLKYFARNIRPWHYGAVYYALQEIKALINVLNVDNGEDVNDGSIDVAFPR